MKVLTVVSHPRSDSLTFQVAGRFVQGLTQAGHTYEMVDLHEIGFDPVLAGMDEPDLSATEQPYSPQVEREMERMRKHDALAFVFPVWWWYLPAMLKGYIDRVWNNGFAYGANHLQHRQVLWIGLAGVSEQQMKKRHYDETLAHMLNIGIAHYCGVHRSRVEFLYETLDSAPAHYELLLEQAYRMGLDYGKEQ